MTDRAIHDAATRIASEPIEAIRDGRHNVLEALERLKNLSGPAQLLPVQEQLCHAARNLKYALDAMAAQPSGSCHDHPMNRCMPEDCCQASEVKADPLPRPAANDIGILLSALRNHEDAVGEEYDDEGGVIAQIERDYLAGVAIAAEMPPTEIKADPLREAVKDETKTPTIDELQTKIFDMSCNFQFELARRLAANVGYVLVGEPQIEK